MDVLKKDLDDKTVILWQYTSGRPLVPLNVLRIDCPNELDEKSLIAFAKAALSTSHREVAEELVDRVGGDATKLCQALRLLKLMKHQITVDHVNRLVPENPVEAFSAVGCQFPHNLTDERLCAILRTRLRQLTLLSVYWPKRTSMLLLEEHLKLPWFVISQLFPLIRRTTPATWVKKLASVEIAAEAARQGKPMVKEWLRCKL